MSIRTLIINGGSSQSRDRLSDDTRPMASQRHWDFRNGKSLRRVLKVEVSFIKKCLFPKPYLLMGCEVEKTIYF